MSRAGAFRESERPDVPPGRGPRAAQGRRCISVIGIDHYRRWNQLRNAVSDARGILAAFEELGFRSIGARLFDDAATGDALRCLHSDLRRELDVDDSLIVFFAGHGHTITTPLPDAMQMSKGYLIPVDADSEVGRDRTWQPIQHWLSDIATLQARHILVILDSCYSGIALSRAIQYRALGVQSADTPVPRHARRSRRVLTSAADDQRAYDGGPFARHSMFTGFLIEELRRGTSSSDSGSSAVGVNELAERVCRRVREHSASQQEPGFGTLELHDDGELMLSIQQAGGGSPFKRADVQDARAAGEPSRDRSKGKHRRSQVRRGIASRAGEREPALADGSDASAVPALPEEPVALAAGAAPVAPVDALAHHLVRTEGWTLDTTLAAALEHHDGERKHGAHVLTVIAGDAMAAQTTWGMWAADHGYLTLATQSVGLDAVVADLLAQTPWLRCIPEARRRLGAAANLDVQAVDAALDARAGAERRRWIETVGALDSHVRVSGWLLSSLRSATASVPDLTTAPVRHRELLAIACDLASPTCVLMFHPAPDEAWLRRAIVTAAELIPHVPAHSVAVTAPEALVTRVLDDRRPGAAWTMARQGLVRVEALGRRRPGRARHTTMRALFEALEHDPRTRGVFELDGRVVCADGPAIDVALVCHRARIAVELDAWYHFHDPEGYRRDRVQDTRLLRAGYFVLRFPAEDVDHRLASTIDQLAIALTSRRAVRAPFQETFHGPSSR